MLQPLLVSTSALTLASETVRSILKIDDIVRCSLDALYLSTVNLRGVEFRAALQGIKGKLSRAVNLKKTA